MPNKQLEISVLNSAGKSVYQRVVYLDDSLVFDYDATTRVLFSLYPSVGASVVFKLNK